MKTTLVIFGMLVALLVIAGCAPKAGMPSAPTATDDAVGAVGDDVEEFGSLSDDLDTSDLNSLDQELADIDSLELQ